jgi:hypothetical protein
MEAARTTRRSRRSGPAEDRAQPAEGGSRRTGGGSGPTTSIRNAGRAFTNRMTAETLGVRADIACVFYICIWAVTTTQSGIDSFWINQISKMQLNRRFERRIKGTAYSVAVSSFELNNCVVERRLQGTAYSVAVSSFELNNCVS